MRHALRWHHPVRMNRSHDSGPTTWRSARPGCTRAPQWGDRRVCKMVASRQDGAPGRQRSCKRRLRVLPFYPARCATAEPLLDGAGAPGDLHPLATRAPARAPEACDRLISIAETALLSVVALLAAWSGYSAAKWGTESSLSLAKASSTRTKANLDEIEATQIRTLDSVSFNAAETAYAANDPKLFRLAIRRLRVGYRPAFEAWLVTHPLKNANAPPDPSYMPQYRISSLPAIGVTFFVGSISFTSRSPRSVIAGHASTVRSLSWWIVALNLLGSIAFAARVRVAARAVKRPAGQCADRECRHVARGYLLPDRFAAADSGAREGAVRCGSRKPAITCFGGCAGEIAELSSSSAHRRVTNVDANAGFPTHPVQG
jgi:hypothetical protein